MSMSDRDGKIWFDGQLIDWRDAKIHVLSHSLHYGLSVFEGVRAYDTELGTAIFRLPEHILRKSLLSPPRPITPLQAAKPSKLPISYICMDKMAS